jgi:hypothetical protein
MSVRAPELVYRKLKSDTRGQRDDLAEVGIDAKPAKVITYLLIGSNSRDKLHGVAKGHCGLL